MISLDCHHPDIEDFITIKSDLDKVTKANISIRVTDDFLQAVVNNDNFKLSFTREETGEVIEKVVRANEIFDKFAQMNWDYAEPAFLFWDRIKKYNLLGNDEEFEYAGVNPCAKVFLAQVKNLVKSVKPKSKMIRQYRVPIASQRNVTHRW